MQIGKLLFPITTLGPGRRVGVWTQGCAKNCLGCSNPELRTFDESKEIAVNDLFTLINAFDSDGVTVSGGEPFLQAAELKALIELINGKGVRDILVYSGYTLAELKSMNNPDIDYVLSNIAVLIDGPFVKELADDIPLRGSSNQRVHVFRKEFEEAYKNCVQEEKRVDVFSFEGETHFIGIPIKGYEEVYTDFVKLKRKK